MIDTKRLTLINWENGYRSPPLDKLVDIARALDVSVDYLLGNDRYLDRAKSVDAQALPALHGNPLWVSERGWALVNTIKGTLVFAGGESVPFSEIQGDVKLLPPMFTLSMRGVGKPLDMDEILRHERVWVEPISTDKALQGELRGWYHPHEKRCVQNEYGNRFYLDTYGAKWLAFETLSKA
jgi:hypothetical protein